MRRYAPLYEGDGILRADAALGERALKVFKSPASAPVIVRSNIPAEAANETGLDLEAIVRTANRERSRQFGRLLKAAYTAVVDWLDRNETWERDSFFAAAENLADLEQRQRHFERTGIAHY